MDEVRGKLSHPPPFESGAGGLVSTVQDMAAFGRMMLYKGTCNGERILSRPSIELMTSDQLTPQQKELSPFFEKFWDSHGWGFGLGVITSRSHLSETPGSFGWDGAFGTCWHVDPKEELVAILMTQRRPDRLDIPNLTLDFKTSVYQMINN